MLAETLRGGQLRLIPAATLPPIRQIGETLPRYRSNCATTPTDIVPAENLSLADALGNTMYLLAHTRNQAAVPVLISALGLEATRKSDSAQSTGW